ncbi:MAG: hypothetical protein ABJK64_07935, partial [Paraglaciecola sp.]
MDAPLWNPYRDTQRTLLFAFNAGCWAVLICAVLCLQDGIWKTFQSRMAERIETVESAISK